MRLINTSTLALEHFIDDIPAYGILSHTWDSDEMLFDDYVARRNFSQNGHKVQFCAEQALQDGLGYCWVDTCCIDKSSSAELSEAINSMFDWYQNAIVCYVYLSDVSSNHSDSGKGLSSQQSRWFTRGWTLLELLAPARIKFFSRDHVFIGTKADLAETISVITTIPLPVIQGDKLSNYSLTERMRWAKDRVTTRPEDLAYSLFGILDVNRPILYGEGRRAFLRLQEQVEKHRINDNVQPDEPQDEDSGNVLVKLQSNVHYNPLSPCGFRLLRLSNNPQGYIITGNVTEHTLINPPTFYALSYNWGQEPPIHQAFINSSRKDIQPNLFYALQRIKPRNGPSLLWVDKLCINQEDNSERNMQVSQMANIYGAASGVWIWLGEEDSSSKLALDFLYTVTDDKFRWPDLWWEEHGFIALTRILGRSWFRRAWVIQEAAFSRNSILLCGDREIHMDHFITAIKTIRDRLNGVPTAISQILTSFHESPAIRLIDTFTGAIQKTSRQNVLRRRMPLEMLVNLSTYAESSDERDAIYSLLNLANDVEPNSRPGVLTTIRPDYTKHVLDVFADFILYCCSQSGRLDVICRPWAPALSTAARRLAQDGSKSSFISYPSWIVSREKLSFGNPAWPQRYRLHGDPLVSRGHLQCYHTHYGTRPDVYIGRTADGVSDGKLHVKGVRLGLVEDISTRMADSIISRDCVSILRKASQQQPPTELDEIPDVVWRTLCADRDEKGQRAPRSYQHAMQYLLTCNSNAANHEQDSHDLSFQLDHMSSIDPLELLETDVPEYVEQFLTVLKDVAWNRRTFRLSKVDGFDKTLVGLVPQQARLKDHICVFYGCSVPVVLREQLDPDLSTNSVSASTWQLIGGAYVHGIMDGEVMSSLSADTRRKMETEFAIV